MVLAFFSENLLKASRDKSKNNNMQMMHLMDSFEAQGKKNDKKGNKWRKMEQKWTWNTK